jgi:hypothetical protein
VSLLLLSIVIGVTGRAEFNAMLAFGHKNNTHLCVLMTKCYDYLELFNNFAALGASPYITAIQTRCTAPVLAVMMITSAVLPEEFLSDP